jgi:hypothetical protein
MALTVNEKALLVYLAQNAVVSGKLPKTLLANVVAEPTVVSGANATIYIAPGGNDTNSGLTASAPLATLQAASDLLSTRIDLRGGTATIYAAPGNYLSATFSGLPVGWGQNSAVVLTGQGAAFATTGGAPAITLENGANLTLSAGITLFGSIGVQVNAGSTLQIGGSCTFGICQGAHIFANGGSVTILAAYNISAGAYTHWMTEQFGTIAIAKGFSQTITNNPHFTRAFATVLSGLILCPLGGIVFTGTATGPRYNIDLGGVINTQGGGPNFLPGNAAGIIAKGGGTYI